MSTRGATRHRLSILNSCCRFFPGLGLLRGPQSSQGSLWQLVHGIASHSVVPMPALSHTMTKGTVLNWLKKAGDPVKQYDIILEVATNELTPDEFKEGDFKGTVTLLIESQEDGVLANLLVPEGQEVPVGTPLAVFCDDAKDAAELKSHRPSTSNVYDQGQEHVPVLMWQSYLKDGKPLGGTCMS